MWQQDAGNDGNALNWCSALAYCESLELADYDNWRLPNVRELQSIVDYGRVQPAIDPVFGGWSSYYWSSTSGARGPDDAWRVNFYWGYVLLDGAHKDYPRYVRAVRTIQPGE
jgi:hypothetical protein